jgi:hypothetical protein
MTALAADRLVRTREVNKLSMPVKTNTVIYAGALVFNDAGYARGGVPTQITPVVGVAEKNCNNNPGSNGAINCPINTGEAVGLVNGAGGDALTDANYMQPVYAIDDQTVGATSGGGTRPIAGILINIDSNGLCWVYIAPVLPPFVVQALAGGVKMAMGQHATVAASDTIVTGLANVIAAFAVLDDAPVLTCDRAQASIGNQAGAPAAGSILLETFMPTDATHPTPIAATTFGKKVNWLALGN